MRGRALFAAAGVALFFLAASSPSEANAQRIIGCASVNDQYTYCDAPNNGVELATQVSNTYCAEGRTWGYDRRGVWVDRGCRATFRIFEGGSRGGNYSRGQRVECASQNDGYSYCSVYTGGHVTLIRQLSQSPCREGRSWGFDDRGIWVNDGCRAEFEVFGGGGWNSSHMSTWHTNDAQMVRCESQDGRYARCRVGVNGRVRLANQLSSTPCVEGRNWGSDRNGIWVNDGCRGEFAIGRSGGNPYRPYPGGGGGTRTVRCESENNRRETCFVGNVRYIELSERLSDAPCIMGSSWGRAGNSIWVSRGCRAEFRVTTY